MNRHFRAALVASALLLPGTAFTQDRDHHSYEDRGHRDSHEWNEREDQAYRRYLKEHHRKYRDFARLNRRDQESYWTWRHQHMDEHR